MPAMPLIAQLVPMVLDAPWSVMNATRSFGPSCPKDLADGLYAQARVLEDSLGVDLKGATTASALQEITPRVSRWIARVQLARVPAPCVVALTHRSSASPQHDVRMKL